MKKIKITSSLFLILMLTCVLFTGCSSNKTNVADTTETQSSDVATESAQSQTAGTSSATISNEEVEFTFVVDTSELDGGSVQETKAKAKGTLGDYVRTLDFCVWEEGQYGIFVHSFYGFENDDMAGLYWSFYIDGEYAMVGADDTPLEAGKTYTWKLETFS